MHVVAVVQARMSSTRLPGKILERVGDRTVLQWTVEAAQEARLVDEVVVATSTDSSDDRTAQLCDELGFACVRGSLDDLVDRFKTALAGRDADAVVRLTADCPLLDPLLIDQCVAVLRADSRVAMSTNAHFRTFPRGLDVEVLSRSAFEWIDMHATGYHRTHVTTVLTEGSEGHVVVNLAGTSDDSDLRVTVDTPEDLALVRAIVDELGEGARDHRRLVGLLRLRPDLVAMNSHIVQKETSEG